MAYNIYNDGFRVLGTRNWDLRWIMTRALLRDTRSVSYRSVACGHQKVFRLRMPYTKHYFGPKAINLIGKLVNRCFADLEVYMPNDQS